ncbi:MAG: T9SS type A sorting domain-containing protein [Bacteroidia bacterium]|nr:T9SS type A sorting domain-containing protein [Bacteroidia bacterium]
MTRASAFHTLILLFLSMSVSFSASPYFSAAMDNVRVNGVPRASDAELTRDRVTLPVTRRSPILYDAVLLPKAEMKRDADPAAEQKVRSAMATASIRFTENRGQVADTDGKPRPEIRYTADAGGTRLYFTATGVSYVFTRTENDDNQAGRRMSDDPLDERDREPEQVSVYRMDMKLQGCNANVRIRHDIEQEGYSNYYLAHCPDGITYVKSYGKLVYENIYDNIDLVYYSDQQKMKYEFIVHPGGNPKDIRMHYDGATNIRVNDNGGLEVETPLGEINEKKPYTHQNGAEVPSAFSLQGEVVGFSVGNYDPNALLVIDPWATYCAGAGFWNVDCDASGNIVAVGFSSGGFPVQNAIQSSVAGSIDWCVIKYSASCTVQWATYYGGSGQEFGNNGYVNRVSIDPAGNIAIAGTTESIDFPVSTGAYQTTFGGQKDCVLVLLTPSGLRNWATYVGGSGSEQLAFPDCASNGSIVLGFVTQSSNMATSNPFQSNLSGPSDGFIVVFSSTGQVSWATYFGGSDDDGCFAAFGFDNSIYVASGTESNNFPVLNPFQATRAGSGDLALSKFSPGRQLLWSTYFGGSGSAYEILRDMTVDGSGNVSIAGQTSNVNFPVYGAFQSVYGGGQDDGFVVKFSSTGTLMWSTFLGGSNTDSMLGIDCDSGGSLYVAGWASSANYPTMNAFQASNAGGPDVVITAFSPGGGCLWSTYYGGTGGDYGYSCTVGSGGAVTVVGNAGPGLPLFNPIYISPVNNAFIASFNQYGHFTNNIMALQTAAVNPSIFCAGSMLQVSFTATGVFNSGNNFTAQLSDATGSFSTPVAIGTLAGTQSGSINCLLPVNAVLGTRYRIRVVASILPWTGTDNGSDLTIGPRPSASITPAGAVPLCPSTSIALTSSGGSGYTYQWLRDGNAIGGAINATYMAALPGLYRVILTSPAACKDTSVATQLVLYSADTTHLVWTGAVSREWSTPGNWNHPCATPGSGDTVVIAGSGQTPISIPSVTLSALEMNNTNGTLVGGQLGITDALILSSGNIDAGAGEIRLGPTAAISGGSFTSHIVTSDTGSLVIDGIGTGARTGAVLFPVGASHVSYTPVSLTNAGTADAFRVRAVADLRLAGLSGTVLTSHAVGRTWVIEEGNPGGSDATITLQWYLNDELPAFLRTGSMIHRFNGSTWYALQPPGPTAGSNPYTRTVYGVTAFSPFAIADSAANLPVELLSFSARLEAGAAIVTWSTASETNNAGFIVERRVGSGPWRSRGFVPGSGTTMAGQEYAFSDAIETGIPAGTPLAYRLRQIDTDGTETVSHEVTVLQSSDPAFSLAQNYPNPVYNGEAGASATIFTYSLAAEAYVRLTIHDALGREVAVVEDGIRQGGMHSVVFDAAALPAGMYMVRLESAGLVKVKRLSVVR